MTGFIDEAHGVKKGSRKLRAPAFARARTSAWARDRPARAGFLAVSCYHEQAADRAAADRRVEAHRCFSSPAAESWMFQRSRADVRLNRHAGPNSMRGRTAVRPKPSRIS